VANKIAYKSDCRLGLIYKIEMTEENDRTRSSRTFRKTFDLTAVFQSAHTMFFATEDAEFATIWWEQNKYQMPSAREIIAGLQQFYRFHLESEASGSDKASLPAIVATYDRVFQQLQTLVNFTDVDKKFTSCWDNTEYDLWCPTSKACFLVLFLYSIEPPLYFFLNDACRKRNKALLPMLGPFANALYWVL